MGMVTPLTITGSVYTILVVDDEPAIVNLAKMILEEEGYNVITASNGDEALQKAEAETPDLILLDVMMPNKSGLEVCKILKSQTETRHIPVVMFTFFGRYVDHKLAVEAGCDGYFMKLFMHEHFTAEVKRHLKKARARRHSS